MTGRMNELVRFERRTADTVTPVGQIGRDWAETGQRWASIEPIFGARAETETAAGQPQSTVRFKLTCQGFLDVLAEDRVVHIHDGRIFGVSQAYGKDGRAPVDAPLLEILAYIADQMEESK